MSEPAIRYEVDEAEGQGGKTTTVRLHGQLILQSADLVRGAVKPLIAEGGHVVIDVGDVQYLDSSGLGALVGLKVSAGNQGCRLELENVTARIREILRITFLTEFFSS
ncbi:MAG TPA: STAS domain-containing protein [Acidobacteriaceae bacterium]|nr:STAS domain-containing protein [Acidobacteriaceae bacterium]